MGTKAYALVVLMSLEPANCNNINLFTCTVHIPADITSYSIYDKS